MILSYDKIQLDNLSKDQKKRVNVLSRPENVTLNFTENDLPPIPPQDDEEKLEPEDTIAEKLKIKKREKNRSTVKNLDFKQTINQASNIISTYKSWK